MNKKDKIIGCIGVAIVSIAFTVMAYMIVFAQMGWWLK